MKRPFLIICAVIVLAMVIGSAEHVLQRTLDQQLPPLLTEELGLPVTISPIKADIITLTASAERLAMGSEEDPALVAEDVKVSLRWSDLLRGEIRLVRARGEDLMVKISAWPSDDEPLPDDYFFLEPWLPKTIKLTRGRYVREDGSTWPIHTAEWQRYRDDGASLSWQENRPAGDFAAEVRLKSLDDVLGMRLFQAQLKLEPGDQDLPPTDLSLRIEPGQADLAFRMQVLGQLAGMQGTLTAEGSEAWQWPEHSETRFDTLFPSRVIELVTLFVADGVEDDLEKELQSPVPQLMLPLHQGTITLGEVRLGNELAHNGVINFNSSGRYLAITELVLEGLYGNLRGSAAVVSNDDTWDAAVAARVDARALDHGLMARYVDAHWYLQQGTMRIKSKGATWGTLLDGMTGDFKLSGAHRGEVDTPVSAAAQLDGSPDKFALQQMSITVGDSTASGSIAFDGGAQRQLSLKVESGAMDLRFLFEEEAGGDPAPGIAMPEFLTLFPGIEVDWDVKLDVLTLPNLSMQSVDLTINRGNQRGEIKLAASSLTAGKLDLQINYENTDNQATRVLMTVNLDEVDLDRTFGLDEGFLESRATGTILFTSSGNGVSEIFHAMRGDAKLSFDLRNDADWGRDSRIEEKLALSGLATLVIENERILGVTIKSLNIDSIEQDISGTLTIAEGRDPAIDAELTSDRLNLQRVIDWVPDSPESADESDFLLYMREIGPGRVQITIGELTWLEDPITDVTIELLSKVGRFDVPTLEFTYLDAHVKSQAAMRWQQDMANFEARGDVSALNLDDVLQAHAKVKESQLKEPLTGHFGFTGEGSTLSAMVTSLSGEAHLAAAAPSAKAIDIVMSRIDRGVELQVQRFNWAGSDLTGSLRYQTLPRPAVDVALSGGVLDLRPWEKEYFPDEVAATKTAKDDSRTEASKPKSGASASGATNDKPDLPDDNDSVVEKSGRFVVDFLSYPARTIKGGKPTPPGQRIFSAEPWDLSGLGNIDVHVHGELASLHSVIADGEQIQLDVKLQGGVIDASATAAVLNGGSADLKGHFDATAEPPQGNLDLKFLNLYPDPTLSNFPRSGHFMLDSRGSSEAELAGNLNGMGILELGKGPVDYRGLRLLTADAATGVFRALIPGAATRQPTMNCGITLASFTEGKGITPYGWAARTRTANLLGAIEVDLKKEELQLRFRSQSREGAGISVGNAFSNSVSVSGPLSDPRIVPNTPGLLVRGWAAFLTAGLSIIGESVFNRVLASGNPCEDIREEIRKDLCVTDVPLASSPLACPTTSPAAEPAAEPATEPATEPTAQPASRGP